MEKHDNTAGKATIKPRTLAKAIKGVTEAALSGKPSLNARAIIAVQGSGTSENKDHSSSRPTGG